MQNFRHFAKYKQKLKLLRNFRIITQPFMIPSDSVKLSNSRGAVLGAVSAQSQFYRTSRHQKLNTMVNYNLVSEFFEKYVKIQ